MSGNDIFEWIICLAIGAALYYAMESCEKKQREDPEPAETSQNITQNAYAYTAPASKSSEEVLEWEPVVEESTNESSEETEYTYSYSYSSSIGGGHEDEHEYANYEETNSCVDGEVVYEGSRDYYIVETASGYTIIERSFGGSLYEGDIVRGPLNGYGTIYIIKPGSKTEVRVYVEDYMLSKSRAIEWMGSHSRLKYSDQEEYDARND